MAGENSNVPSKHVIDLTGKTFGKWVVLEFRGISKSRRATWLCRCDCGKTKVQPSNALLRGTSKSCATCGRYRHGQGGNLRSPEYRTWANMLTRCRNPQSTYFNLYGGRGISVCSRWHVFQNFLDDMGLRPSKLHSLDRIDSDGHYELDNCRWATQKQQARNKRNNRLLTFNGDTRCLAEWSAMLGLNYYALQMRLTKGWSVERALTTPVRHMAARRTI